MRFKLTFKVIIYGVPLYLGREKPLLNFFIAILEETAFLDVRFDTFLSFNGLSLINFQFPLIFVALLLFLHLNYHPSLDLILLMFLLHVFLSEPLFLVHGLFKLFEFLFYLFVLIT